MLKRSTTHLHWHLFAAMAPKAASPKGKAAKGKSDGKSDKADAAAAEEGDAPATSSSVAAPQNKDEVLAQVNLDGLPHCPVEQIIDLLKGAPRPRVPCHGVACVSAMPCRLAPRR
jgi:hypothetical protein